MANYRMVRINEETARTLAQIVREVKDPRVAGAFVSITGADVSRDLKYAKVFWSSLAPSDDDGKEIAAGLKSCTGFMRKRLAEELNLRITPELHFVRDKSAANGAHISSILRDIIPEDGAGTDDKKD